MLPLHRSPSFNFQALFLLFLLQAPQHPQSLTFSVLFRDDWYGFFEADTDISAIHGLIADTDNHYFRNF